MDTAMGEAKDAGRYETIRLDHQICFPLYACAKEVVRLDRGPLGQLGLTYTQYVVMMALWEHGSMTEGELGRIVHLDSGTLAPLLKRLEGQGLIDRARKDRDERRLFLSLTEKGEEMREQALEVPKAMRGCLDLPDEELLLLKSLLDKALARMDEKRGRNEKEEKQ